MHRTSRPHASPVSARGMRRVLAGGVALVLAASTLALVPASPAAANGGPPPPAPAFPDAARVRTVSTFGLPRPNYGDVPSTSSIAPAVAWLVEEGIVARPGASRPNYAPSGTVSRRQLAVFLWKFAGQPAPTAPCQVADVPPSAAVCWALESGVIAPSGRDRQNRPLFGPNVTVSRAGMALMLHRLTGQRTGMPPTSFADVPRSASFAVAVDWMVEFGLARPGGSFQPSSPLTRAQMALFLFRLAAYGDAWNPGVRVTGSAGQLSVVGVPGTRVGLYTDSGNLEGNGILDENGGLLWRDLVPGDYVVAVGDGAGGTLGWRATVSDLDLGNVERVLGLYAHQTLRAGFNYLTMRDGTQLAAMVSFPAGPGPYPTLVEYSGYDLANPYDPTSGRSPYRLVSPTFGYALVQVQMRGGGCSGGAFDYFEPLQSLDGYDIIETVAAQSWAARNRATGRKAVGMVGISYPGISQLFVAQTAPPSLAAITPVSVVPDMARGVLYPGGIYNNGFARDWAQGAVNRARPSRQQPNGTWTGAGMGYVDQRINGSAGEAPDITCRLNQRLHGQQPDLIGRIEATRYETEGDHYLSPMRFVGNIRAATLLVGAWQDEQTGGLWPILMEQFDPATDVRLIAQNGTHIEPIMPDNLRAAFEHLAMYVKGDRPGFNVPALNALVGLAVSQLFGGASPPPGGALQFRASPFDEVARYPTFASAFNAYRAQPPVVVRFDNGAGPQGQAGGSLVAAEFRRFSSFPLPDSEATNRVWYLDADGSNPGMLADTAPTERGEIDYTYDNTAGQQTLWRGGQGCNEWTPAPTDNRGDSCFDWQSPDDANQASFLTQPLTADTIVVGGGLVDLVLRWDPGTDAPEERFTDVEVTLSEVTSEGKEVYVQTGWLRTSFCKDDLTLSTPLTPWATGTVEDAEACVLQRGVDTAVRVPIFPFGHIFRTGSQLRLTVDAPGGSRVLWKFGSAPDAASNTIVTGPTQGLGPSALTLPVVTHEYRNVATGVVPPVWRLQSVRPPQLATPPECGILRAQPCRPFVAPG